MCYVTLPPPVPHRPALVPAAFHTLVVLAGQHMAHLWDNVLHGQTPKKILVMHRQRCAKILALVEPTSQCWWCRCRVVRSDLCLCVTASWSFVATIESFSTFNPSWWASLLHSRLCSCGGSTLVASTWAPGTTRRHVGGMGRRSRLESVSIPSLGGGRVDRHPSFSLSFLFHISIILILCLL